MEQAQTILEGYSDQEKGAYLGAIASIATADRKASEEELQYLSALAKAASLSEQQEASVIRAATELSADELKRCLDILKDSSLKYSLVADLITFAKVDDSYSEDEKSNVEKIVDYLQVDRQQFSLLDQFVDKTTERQPNPEEVTRPGFI
ncbi:MAG TPA: TerB family tellurite resistance protein, partial [Chryseosolibacter sp.]|nr:TerB family tellurite resistance protein [Chryseosolibacter sp.]